MMSEKRRQSKRNINQTAPIVRGSSGSPLVNRLAHWRPDPLDSADINILIPQIRFTLGTRPIAILLEKEKLVEDSEVLLMLLLGMMKVRMWINTPRLRARLGLVREMELTVRQ